MGAFSLKRTPGRYWTLYAFLSPRELAAALGQFPAASLFITNGRVPADTTGEVSRSAYLRGYERYFDSLAAEKLGRKTATNLYVSLTLDAADISAEACSDPQFKLLQWSKPLVHASPFEVAYATGANKVRLNCMDMKHPLHMGLAFSHPNIWNDYQADPDQPVDTARFPNVALMGGLAEWAKTHTHPCKVKAKGKEQSLGVRMGPDVLRWISEHHGFASHALTFPGRPFVADPSWLTPTVMQLARAIQSERSFDALPALGDALEEAGCADADLLAHCRGRKPHAQRCWVVDGLLGKSAPKKRA